MTYEVVWERRAKDDIERIKRFIADDNERAALGVVDRITQAGHRLGSLPFIGHAKVKDMHEWVVKGLPYIIVYEVVRRRREVRIDAVFHGAQER